MTHITARKGHPPSTVYTPLALLLMYAARAQVRVLRRASGELAAIVFTARHPTEVVFRHSGSGPCVLSLERRSATCLSKSSREKATKVARYLVI